MPASLDGDETRTTIHLEAEMGIASAAELKSLLIEALSRGKGLCIDLGETAEIDATVLQLLYATRDEAERRGMGFALAGPVPAAVRATIEQAGLSAAFPDLHA